MAWGVVCMCMAVCLLGCAQTEGSAEAGNSSAVENLAPVIMITVGDEVLTAVPEENPSAEAFIARLKEAPITVNMSDYAGMEKVGPLGTSLPRSDTHICVGAGDVVLYQGDQITIYYGSNAWKFTRLAVIEDATRERLLQVLGDGDVEVTFSIV